ncbi:MAG: HepT-like ribonuclease domain-containing protein [Thermoprotei archaeon]
MIVRDRLAFAKNCIGILYKLRSSIGKPEDIVDDPVLRGAIERYLHLVLEAIIDTGMRLASIMRLGKPERYRDVAKMLRNCGILDDSEAKRLELWIGLRNILVHGYAEIDYEKLYEALNEIEELERFINKIYRYTVDKNIDPEIKDEEALIAKAREALEKRSDILFAYIFGSRATGRYRDKSDIDIAIYTEKPLRWREFVELALELEDSLGIRVDLVDLRTAPLILAYEIISNGVVIIDRNREKRVEFETRILKEYLDLKPRLEKYYDEILSG